MFKSAHLLCCKPERDAYNAQELTPLHDDHLQWYLGVHLGRGAQPQASGSGAGLKKLSIKLATPNSPSTVLRIQQLGLLSNGLFHRFLKLVSMSKTRDERWSEMAKGSKISFS